MEATKGTSQRLFNSCWISYLFTKLEYDIDTTLMAHRSQYHKNSHQPYLIKLKPKNPAHRRHQLS